MRIENEDKVDEADPSIDVNSGQKDSSIGVFSCDTDQIRCDTVDKIRVPKCVAFKLYVKLTCMLKDICLKESYLTTLLCSTPENEIAADM